MLFKNLITVFFLVISLASCTSTNELIKQERIHKGMTKSSLWDSMLDVPPNEDVTWPNCYRAFYPDKQFEILSSPSMNMFFVFEEVTIQSDPSNCEAQGNGYLFGYYNSFDDAIAVVSSKTREDQNINSCPETYEETTWIDGCFGSFTYTDGSQYMGEWERGGMHGQGRYTWDNGNQYIGEFENDKIQGQGTFTSANGDQYIGEFENGAMHGQGTYTWPNGDQYLGEWENGVQHGLGTSTLANGEKFVGEFKNGEKVKNNQFDNSFVNIISNEDSSELIEASSGTGFAVTYSGYLITSEHVVSACEKINVRNTENVISEAKIIASDKMNDLVLLKTDIEPLRVLSVSKSSPEQLQSIFVAGFPWGERVSSLLTITDGMVTNPSGVGNNFANFTHNAAIQPGNSGGPIVNFGGNVVGVAVSKLDANSILDETGFIPENTNYGVKSNILLNLLESKGIKTVNTSSNDIKKSEMTKLLNESTYFISCEMTTAKIKEMQTKKVMYRNLLQ